MLSKTEQVKKAQWLIADASAKKFYGRIVIIMEAGNIVHIEKSQGIKVEEIQDEAVGR